MAGQPRSRGASTQTLRQGRPKRRLAQVKAEIRTSSDAAERLMAACDYVRGALRRRNPDQSAADRRVDELTRQIIALGTEVLREQAREPRKAA